MIDINLQVFKYIVSVNLPIHLLIMKTKTLLVVAIRDKESLLILKVVLKSKEPLETKEIGKKLPKISRSKILYRLNNLRGEGVILGKQVGAGKKTWIWWKKKAFA